ncbi:MAG: DUF2878 domain-containing protein [Gammaproteobacteria bacterium]|nr:DUF2878 domain-containing protein [Gammaproteobacteria bacterium]MDH3407314.1 DUF2878 domain-containing protein [Gammaproteobacteria bacterium]MDH3563012.1 DUF2878 domain-containing protein [Gammaproteobacteria bacterium]MDH5488134.1 DUF2878 domain-containing protein [Gammaproteobacteria bacterium]
MNVFVNFILFQAGWFACVLGAANGQPLAGTGIALTIVLLHVLRSARPRVEVALVLLVAAIGTVWDSGVMLLGVLNYTSGLLFPYVVPPWMIALWMVFATTLNISLRWLKTRPLLAALLGATGGPAAYYAGHALGAVGMPEVVTAVSVQGLGWGILVPLLVWLSIKFDGVTGARRETQPCLT